MVDYYTPSQGIMGLMPPPTQLDKCFGFYFYDGWGWISFRVWIYRPFCISSALPENFLDRAIMFMVALSVTQQGLHFHAWLKSWPWIYWVIMTWPWTQWDRQIRHAGTLPLPIQKFSTSLVKPLPAHNLAEALVTHWHGPEPNREGQD